MWRPFNDCKYRELSRKIDQVLAGQARIQGLLLRTIDDPKKLAALTEELRRSEKPLSDVITRNQP